MTSDMKYFKINGIYRSSTNYVSSILLNNFLDTTVFMNVGGWKHDEIIEFPDNIELVKHVDVNTKNNIKIEETVNLFANNKVHFIITVRDPYRCISSFSEWDKTEITPEFLIRYVTNWNKLYFNYKCYIECQKAFLIKYEELLQQPNQIMDKIKSNFNLIKRQSEYIFENKKLLANSDSCIGRTSNIVFKTDEYLKQNIFKLLSSESIKIINDNINIQLLKFYDYKLLT